MSTEKEAREVTEGCALQDRTTGTAQHGPPQQDFDGEKARAIVEIEETGATGHSGERSREK